MSIAIKLLQNRSGLAASAVGTASSSTIRLNESFVKAFRSFEAAASIECNRIKTNTKGDAQSLQNEADGHLLFLQEHLSPLGKMAKTMTSDEKKVHRQFVTNSDIHSEYMKAPCLRRAYTKPRGYAGDAELMEMIYRNEFEGANPFEKVVHRTINDGISCAEAVRGRKDYLKNHIVACEGGRILSMAAGPAREIREYLQENPSTASQFLALDHDTHTLKSYSIDDPRFEYAIANAFHFIRGDNTIAFPRKLPYFNHQHDSDKDFKGISALFAPLHYKLTPLPEKNFDLVYSVGLFDYIMDFESTQKGCKALALTRFLFDLDFFLCDILCDWQLFHRHPEDLYGFLDGLDVELVEDATTRD